MSSNLFNSVKLNRPRSNRFDLSHDVKLSCNMGDLVPTLCMEVVPGDSVSLGCDSLVRLAPMIAPMMHRVDVSMHYFFVPNRILWKNWEDFITNTKRFGVVPSAPYVHIGNATTGSFVQQSKLTDYLGIPPSPVGAPSEKVSAFPMAAYTRVWLEYFRDQNMTVTDIQDWMLADGDNTSTFGFQMLLRKRAWEHDYFTACLPFAQKGDPVQLDVLQDLKDVDVLGLPVVSSDGSSAVLVNSVLNEPSGTPANGIQLGLETPTQPLANSQLFAKTSDLDFNAITINDLRQAVRLQEWLERAARGGSRYIENIKAHFGVSSSDRRLQRPEYIVGTKSPVVISEVLNMTGTDDAPQGAMAGHGFSVTAGKYGHYRAEEHGWIIGVMSVMPKTAYQQGIDRKFTKFDQFDYFWPSFAHLGEQEVANRELYAWQGATGDDTFGYLPRYAEYKFQGNRVAGDFRTSLDFWHMGRIFSAPPVLNELFVYADPTTRVFADTDEDIDHLWCQVLHKITARRLMPKFGTPYL